MIKKCNIRDYATSAFRFYAASRKLNNSENELADIRAVENTLKRVDKETRKAIEIVYFEDAKKPLRKNDISYRVHKAELIIHMSERQIYYALKKARIIFAEERGLRVEK